MQWLSDMTCRRILNIFCFSVEILHFYRGICLYFLMSECICSFVLNNALELYWLLYVPLSCISSSTWEFAYFCVNFWLEYCSLFAFLMVADKCVLSILSHEPCFLYLWLWYDCDSWISPSTWHWPAFIFSVVFFRMIMWEKLPLSCWQWRPVSPVNSILWTNILVVFYASFANASE